MPGPPKTPTKLALLKGEQKSRINQHEAQPDPEMAVEPPEGVDLGVHGRREWDRLIRDLINKGIATGWDIQTLAAWCKAVDEHWTAAETIDEEGSVLADFRVHPAWRVLQDSRRNMLQLSARFGFTPSDRAALSISPHADKKPGEDLLTG